MDPVVVVAPVRLHQGGVHVPGENAGTLGAHGLDKAASGQVHCVPEDAFTAGGDQVQGSRIDTAVGQPGAFELSQDKRFNVFAGEFV